MELIQKLGRMPIMLVIPALAILLSVVGLPLLQLFLDSFNAPEFSIANYQAFFGKSGWPVLIQTITISLVVTAICLIVGYPLAYLIMATSKRLRTILIVLIVLPWLTSALVRTYAWTVILGDHGLINNLLLDLGVISSPLSLIYNRFGAYIGMVHIMLPTMILPLLSVMNGIDKSLMEAGRSMGARPFEAFWRIFVPLSLPGVRSGSLLVFVVCLGFYITPQALGGLREIMLATYIAETFRSTSNLPTIATSAFILLALAMLVLSIFGLDLSGPKASDASFVRTTWLNRLNPLRKVADRATNHHRSKRWTAELYQGARPKVWPRIIGGLYVALAMAFLQFPGLVIVVMSFSAGAFLEFPPAGFSLKWYYAVLGDPGWMGSFFTSLKLGVAVAILSTIIGTLAAYGIDRTSPRLRNILTMAILTPITAPVIVMGVAAYFGLLNLGLIGSTTGVVLAHSVGAIALVVVTVSATFANFDKQLERAALSMRANPLRTFVRVTLPLIRPGIIGGALFAFISSFDEVVVTSLVGGFSVYTLPLKMLENLKQQIDPTLAAVGSLLTLMPLLWLVALYLTWWRKRLTSQTSSLKEA
ncbi:ABC transporter permease subunit [Phyllobacterium zundukense]|uniref:ABC transporter permease subunit n=1 Tax=Phyllobacterium zundukense TaxID=1867719 RepID=A0ACD4CVI9_9HYPH|nr:ABC transporter permease subunit [Phyllobacterium zundukense]UXN57607.1 ABC transporter permease subunit [Phyllobacterium zundukense]